VTFSIILFHYLDQKALLLGLAFMLTGLVFYYLLVHEKAKLRDPEASR
jgi:hypothetical protein